MFHQGRLKEILARLHTTGVDDAKLCIWLPSTESELLNVEYWDNSTTSWQLLGALNKAAQWNNFTVTDYLDSPFKIRLVGTDEVSDGTPNSWNVDIITLTTSILQGSGAATSILVMETDWPTDGIAMALNFTDSGTFAQLNATRNAGPLTAEWDIDDLAVDNEQLIMRWQYVAASAPSTTTFQVILEHDGTNTTVNLLFSAGEFGTSPWFVFHSLLSDLVTDISTLEKVYLRAVDDVMRVAYIAITPRGGFATDGTVLADSFSGLISGNEWSPVGFKTTASSFVFDSVDHRLSEDTILSIGFAADSQCTYSLLIHGFDDLQVVRNPETVSISTVGGRNDIILKLSEQVENITIITSVEMLISGSNRDTDFDYLVIVDESRVSQETSTDLWEFYLSDYYGLGLENATGVNSQLVGDGLEFTPLVQSSVVSAAFDMFVGFANYSMSGSAAQTVAFLNDGLPPMLWWQPNNVLGVYTDGRSMNLYVETQLLTITVGENETGVVLDEVTVLGVDHLRFEVMMTGWFNGTQIIRNYTVTTTGMVNWTTTYGAGAAEIESVSVWTPIDSYTPLTALSLMESTSEIVDKSPNIVQLVTADPMTEGEHSLNLAKHDSGLGWFVMDFEDFDLLDNRYLHLTIKAEAGTDLFRFILVTNESVDIHALSFDNDTEWSLGESFADYTVTEIWIDMLTGLDTTNLTQIIDRLRVEYEGIDTGIWIDDVFRTSVLGSGQDELRWQVKTGFTFSPAGYLTNTTYTDSESLSLMFGEALSGVTVYAEDSDLRMEYDDSQIQFGIGSDIALGGSIQTFSGSFFAGTRVDSPELFAEMELPESTTVDLVESGTVHYIADLAQTGDVDITFTFHTGADGPCGDRALTVVVSTANVTGLGLPYDETHYYLNLSDDYRGSVYLNAYDLALRLNLSEWDIDSNTHSYEYFSDATFPPSSWLEYAYNGRTDWDRNSGGFAEVAYSVSPMSGILESPAVDTSGAWQVSWDTETRGNFLTNSLLVQARTDTGVWDTICVVSPSGDWQTASWSSIESKYLHSNFRVRYVADGLLERYANIDDHHVVFITTTHYDALEFPSRYSMTVSVGSGEKPSVRVMNRARKTPLVAYSTLDLSGSALSEKNSGISYDAQDPLKSGYIENWLASPGDMSSGSLFVEEMGGSYGMKRPVYGGTEADAGKIMFYMRAHIALEGWGGWGGPDPVYSKPVHFISITDTTTGLALDIGLHRIWESQLSDHYYLDVTERGMYAAPCYVPLKTIELSMEEFDSTWSLVTLDLASKTLKVQTLDANMQVNNTYETDHFYTAFESIDQVSIQDDLGMPYDEWLFDTYLDDLRAYSGSSMVFRETFSHGDVGSLPGWERSGPWLPIRIVPDEDVDNERTIYDIDPVILANYDSISAQLEFLNGWYRATRYSDTGAYADFITGYSESFDVADPENPAEYYQHYHTILDISETGLHTLQVSGDINSQWLFYIDGVDTDLDVSGTVTKYLRKGLHTLYLRTFHDDTHVNAFRVRLLRDSNPVEDAQAFVAEHGRYSVVYYDWEHAQRLGFGESPSFYEGPTTALDHADVMMGASPMLGMVVGVGARHLAQYMMRDVMSRRWVNGKWLSPLVTTAGTVLFSSDLVPDNVFSGQSEGSILEDFLESFGYVLVDGGRPFTVVSHRDGTTTEVLDGTERVLDLDNETIYVTDDHAEHYTFRDAVDQTLFLDGDGPDAWGESHNYRVEIDDYMLDSGWGYEANFSSGGFVLYRDFFGAAQEGFRDDTAAFMVPPGDLKFVVYIKATTDDNPVTRLELLLSGLEGDRISNNAFSSYPGSIAARSDADSMRWVTLADGSRAQRFTFSLTRSAERELTTSTFISNLGLWFRPWFKTPQRGPSLVALEIHDEYNVRLASQIEYPLLLSAPSTGYLQELAFDPVMPPPGRKSRNVDFDILAPDDTSIATLTAKRKSSLWPYELRTGDVSDQDILLTKTSFDESEQYKVKFISATTSSAVWLKYIWKYRENSDYTTYAAPSRWAISASIGLKRSSGSTMPSDIGRMLPADLYNFTPRYAMDTAKLSDQGRKFIDYAGYGNEYSTLANPITMQADSFGGGVISYGISTPITYDHVMGNASISGLFMQMIAQHNFMNLWGVASRKNSVVNTSIGVVRWDEVQLLAQEGWTQEVIEGSGALDVWTFATLDDYNGADWFDAYGEDEVYMLDDTLKLRQPTQELAKWDDVYYDQHLDHGDYPMIRYPKVAARYVEFDIDIADLQAVHDFNDGPLYLEALFVLRDLRVTKNVTIFEDTTTIRIDLEELEKPDEWTYLSTAGDIVMATSYGWGLGTITPYLMPFLDDALTVCVTQDPLKPNDDSLIYDGSGVAVALDAVQTPLLVTAIYEKDPSTILAGDVAGHMANLVSFDYDYLRMTTDHEYAAEYKSRWNQFEVNQVYMKPILITTGAVMAGAGAAMMLSGIGFAAGLPLYIFGLDMICTHAFEKSFIERGLAHSLDYVLHNAPRFQNQNLSWIEGENFEAFSYYHFHSNHLVNIILVQLTFMMLGGVFSGFAGLRGVVTNVATSHGIMSQGTSVSFLSTLGRMTTRQLITVAARWASRLAIHLSCGVVFMALGAMRNSWGDGGVAAELLIQGLIIATVILRTRQAFIAKNTIPEMQAAEGAMDMRFMEENRPWWAEHALGNIYELWKLFSAKGSIVQAFKAATSVEFACDCLELSVTLGGGFVG